MNKMIRDIVLYTSGGDDPFTGYYTVGYPITSSSKASVVLSFYPVYARLMVFIPSMTGTITFTVGNPLGLTGFTLTITSPTTFHLIYTGNQTVLVYVNGSWQVISQQILAYYNIFMNGVYVSWEVVPGSTVSAYIHFEFDDGTNEA
jgi:hypothetical protein